MQSGGNIRRLVGPFSDVVDSVVKDEFVRNWLDLLSFLLSGNLCLLLLCDALARGKETQDFYGIVACRACPTSQNDCALLFHFFRSRH